MSHLEITAMVADRLLGIKREKRSQQDDKDCRDGLTRCTRTANPNPMLEKLLVAENNKVIDGATLGRFCISMKIRMTCNGDYNFGIGIGESVPVAGSGSEKRERGLIQFDASRAGIREEPGRNAR